MDVKRFTLGLEKWLSNWEHLHLFQRPWVLFPGPIRDSHPPVTPASEDPLLPSGFTCAYIHIYMQTLNTILYRKRFHCPICYIFPLFCSFFFFLELIFFLTVTISSILRQGYCRHQQSGSSASTFSMFGEVVLFSLGWGQDSIFTLHPRVKLKSQSSYLSRLSAGTTSMCRHTQLPLDV